jgi:hypothetical protein
MASMKGQKAAQRRAELREELWPDEPAWTAKDAVGFFQAPRTLPLLLALIKDKKISGMVAPLGN